MKKRMITAAAALVLCISMICPAYAGQWKEDNGRWMYQRGKNKYAHDEWIKVDNQWYYINSAGYMATGWVEKDKHWYYLNENGVMQVGWLKSDDSWYYLYPDGSMAVSEMIGDRQLGEDGKWIPAEGQLEPQPGPDYDMSTARGLTLETPASQSGYTVPAMARVANWENWEYPIRIKGKGGFVSYELDGSYKVLTGKLSTGAQMPDNLVAQIQILGDNDQVLYTSRDTYTNVQPYYFRVSVENQHTVKLLVTLTKDNYYSDPIVLVKDLTVFR